jgi:LAO/AO transport system kinase
MFQKSKNRLTPQQYYEGILNGDRVILSRAVTLIESTLETDQQIAEILLEKTLPHTGNSIRIGITGIPGVGKSTFIEALGQHITAMGKKLAVLAIDPSSQKTAGSILGDKTRMPALSQNPLAYVRPSASGNTLGGTAHKTREAILLCEAAGYEIIIVETVGVGQSETSVSEFTDFFLLLLLAGAGDELQGIKRGIMEMAQGIAITKADGSNKPKAKKAQRAYQNALHLFPADPSGWKPKVLMCSALQNEGISDCWKMITEYCGLMKEKNLFENKRNQQNIHHFHSLIKARLLQNFFNSPKTSQTLENIRTEIEQGKLTPNMGVRRLF